MNWAEEEVSDDEVEQVREQTGSLSVQSKEGGNEQQQGRGEALNQGSRNEGGGAGDSYQRGGDRGGGGGDNYQRGGDRGGRGDYQDRGGGGGRGGDRRDEPRGPVEIPMTGPFVAYVGNLSYNTDEQALGEYFHSNGCDIDEVKVQEGRGFGHITFTNRESLELAMSANETELDRRRIRVDVDRKRGGDGDRGGRGGGDRDRDGMRGDRNNNISDREEVEADAWSRGSKNQAAPRRERSEGGYERAEGRSGEGRSDRMGGDRPPRRDDGPMQRGQEVKPKSRPTINIAPRSIPVEAVGSPAAASSIFGDAKPRDEKVFIAAKKEANDAKKAERAERAEKNKEGGAARGERKTANADPAKKGGSGSGSWEREGPKKKQDDAAPRINKGPNATNGNGNKDNKDTKDTINKEKKTTEKKEPTAIAKAPTPAVVDERTDEEKFTAAQLALQSTNAPTAAAIKKAAAPKNVFAAGFGSDSD